MRWGQTMFGGALSGNSDESIGFGLTFSLPVQRPSSMVTGTGTGTGTAMVTDTDTGFCRLRPSGPPLATQRRAISVVEGQNGEDCDHADHASGGLMANLEKC